MLILKQEDKRWAVISTTRSLGLWKDHLSSNRVPDASQYCMTSASCRCYTSALVSTPSAYISSPSAWFINRICINKNNLLIKDGMIKSKYVEKKYIYRKFGPIIFLPPSTFCDNSSKL